MSSNGSERAVGFGGEHEDWTRAYLAAVAYSAVSVATGRTTADSVTNAAVGVADETMKMLAARQDIRDAAKRVADRDDHAKLEVAAETVRATGCYVSSVRSFDLGAVYEVTDVNVQMKRITITRRGDETSYRHVPLLAFVVGEEDMLSEENHGLVAAPEKAMRSVLALLKVCQILGCSTSDVTLVWDGDEEDVAAQPGLEPRIFDVLIGAGKAFRPHRQTWEKLVVAGLPIASYDTAALSWMDGA
jgi:hypothetical protein